MKDSNARLPEHDTGTPSSSPALSVPRLELLASASPASAPVAAHPATSLPAAPSAPRKMSRNGKIARLPKLQRDMVNRMLRNNLPYSKIVGALEELDVQVTERNVSNWRTRGGYREWCAEQDSALQVRLFQDNLLSYLRTHDASQVPEVGLQLVATYLSEFLLKPEARQQITTGPDKFARLIGCLCRLSSRLHALQKYRDDSARELGRSHSPEYVRREMHENIENVRKIYSSKIAEGTDSLEIPHRNYLPSD